MKKIMFFIALYCFTLPVFSQTKNSEFFYFSAGYSMGAVNYSGLDFVIDRYNQTRTSLTKQLNKPAYYTGYVIGGGLNTGKFRFEAQYAQKKSPVVSAEASNRDIVSVRELYVTTNFLSLGFACNLFRNKLFDIAAGVSADIGSGKVYTRVYQRGSEVPDFRDIDEIAPAASNTLIGFSVYPDLMFKLPLRGLSLLARPYLHLQITDMDWKNANRVLNNSTHLEDPVDKQSGKINTLGFELKLAYVYFL